MKGLLISLAVVLFVTAAGFGGSFLMHINLVSSLETAGSEGYGEGLDDGYAEGLIEGSIAGYQEGSKAGYIFTNKVAAATYHGLCRARLR